MPKSMYFYVQKSNNTRSVKYPQYRMHDALTNALSQIPEDYRPSIDTDVVFFTITFNDPRFGVNELLTIRKLIETAVRTVDRGAWYGFKFDSQ